MIIDPRLGGQAQLSSDDYIEGAPEFVAEVAASTASIDLNSKLRVYRRNNVREYLVWRVLDDAIDWFVLRKGKYNRLAPGRDGICRGEIFPGLWLNVEAMVRRDIAAVLITLQQGLSTQEHHKFIARLRSHAKP